MSYTKPIQHRAIETENRFLDALNECLTERSFEQTSIDDIANRAGLHRGAFLKRFGNKRQALLVLFSRYCDRASAVIQEIQTNIHRYPTVDAICLDMSIKLENIQKADFGSNRAMQEDFLSSFETNPLTKKIFSEAVELMKCVQQKFLKDQPFTSQGALAATQLLVSINYNYVIHAMPALPRDDKTRHELIGRCMCAALVL